MTAMTPGSNIPLSAPAWRWTSAAPVRLDVSGLLLTADGKVRSDDDFIFYNQPAGPGVTYRSGGGTAPDAITVDTAAVPAGIEKIVVTASPDAAGADLPGHRAHRHRPQRRRRHRRSPPSPRRSSARETALVVVEIYLPQRRLEGPRGRPGVRQRAGGHRHRLRRHRRGARRRRAAGRPARAPPPAPPAAPAPPPRRRRPAAPAAPPAPPAARARRHREDQPGQGPGQPPEEPDGLPGQGRPPAAVLRSGWASAGSPPSAARTSTWTPRSSPTARSATTSTACYFGKLSILNGAIKHSGDNLTGEGAGDDEVDHRRPRPAPARRSPGLVFTVNSFSGQKFTEVAKAYCRLLDAATGEELVRFDLTSAEPQTGVMMAKLDQAVLRRVGDDGDGRLRRVPHGPGHGQARRAGAVSDGAAPGGRAGHGHRARSGRWRFSRRRRGPAGARGR